VELNGTSIWTTMMLTQPLWRRASMGVAARLWRSEVFSSTRRSFSSSGNDPPEVGYVHVSIAEAEATTAKALRAIGWDEQDAALQAEIMTAAELCGNNQGLIKMYQPQLMAPSPDAQKPKIVRESTNSAVIDAQQAPGMLAAVTAADLAVKKLNDDPTSNLAISIVCTHNSSTSSGQLGYYAERMARQGMVGVILANSPEFVAAAPGGKGVFGTNPMAVGIPLQGSPYPFTVRTTNVLSDCAPAACSLGNLLFLL